MRAARAIVARRALPTDWHDRLAEDARIVFNRCLEPHVASRTDILLTTTHMRALCLALTEASVETAPKSTKTMHTLSTPPLTRAPSAHPAGM